MSKPTVMISSTARDLPEHREVAKEACLDCDMLPKMMENRPAVDSDAVEDSLAAVDAADLYLGILGRRYGYVPEGEERSITEMEYDRAVATDTPRLMFLMGDEHPVKFSDIEMGPGAAKLQAFRERVQTDRVVEFFDSPAMLGTQIVKALGEVRLVQLKSRAFPEGFDLELDDTVVDRMVGSSRSLARAFATRVAGWFEERFRALEKAARSPALRDNEKAAHAGALEALWPWFEDVFPGGIYTLDAEGEVLHQHTPLFPEMADITGYKAGHKPYFTECRDRMAPYVADSFTSADRQMEILVVAVPRVGDEGDFIGILDAVIDVPTAPFSDMAGKVAATGLKLEVDRRPQLYLVDDREIVLGSTRPDRVGRALPSYERVERLLADDDPDPRLTAFGAVAEVPGTSYRVTCFWEKISTPPDEETS